MKKVKWNKIIFLCYGAYCFLFCTLFWTLFSKADLLENWFDLMYKGLFITAGIHAVIQLIAVARLEKYAGRFFLLGGLLFFLAVGFTVGQGV